MNDAQDNESAGALVSAIARRLKRERERHGVSASELARRAGIAKSTLTQLEAAKGNPSVETLWALAVALGVPFAQLIDTPRPSIRVVRVGEGVTTQAEHSNYKATLLAGWIAAQFITPGIQDRRQTTRRSAYSRHDRTSRRHERTASNRPSGRSHRARRRRLCHVPRRFGPRL